jgi:hypothetical protein
MRQRSMAAIMLARPAGTSPFCNYVTCPGSAAAADAGARLSRIGEHQGNAAGGVTGNATCNTGLRHGLASPWFQDMIKSRESKGNGQGA